MGAAAGVAVQWQWVAITALTLALTLGGFIAKSWLADLRALSKQVSEMEKHSIAVHVTKQELRDMLREVLEPINRKLGAVVEALEAQSIHVRHT